MKEFRRISERIINKVYAVVCKHDSSPPSWSSFCPSLLPPPPTLQESKNGPDVHKTRKMQSSVIAYVNGYMHREFNTKQARDKEGTRPQENGAPKQREYNRQDLAL